MADLPSYAKPMGLRVFLFLQGPHGHFFSDLAATIKAAGHDVFSIGLNRGDEFYWADKDSYHRFDAPGAEWRAYLREFIKFHGITDVVLYGDTREIHRIAKLEAEKAALRIHCFEEGYLRPYWITYERGGNNGNSLLMQLPRQIYEAQHGKEPQINASAGQWGALWHHTWFGCNYHANILFRNGNYASYATHRDVSVRREWALHCKRLALLPWRAHRRRRMTRRLLDRARPYSVFLLQLPHDASVVDHSPIKDWTETLRTIIAGFAKGAPSYHLLVFKAHPLDDERVPFGRLIERFAAEFGVADRVVCIPPGKLGALLDHAHSALTINSTAGQQVLFRGLPLKTFGRAIYARPELVSDQNTVDFFRNPKRPDREAYMQFRAFLLATSQVQGDYYTRRGRAKAIRNVVGLLFAEEGPYAIEQQARDGNATNPVVVSP